jgi:predicted transcriptional regulator
MYTNCDEIFKITIPAVRIAIAKSLNKKYKMNQSEIAKRLGIAQAAVSKYLSNRYSTKIAKVERIITSKKLEQPIIRMIVAKRDKKTISQSIDRLASSGYMIKQTLRII